MKKLISILSVLLILCLLLTVVSCKDKGTEDDVNGTDESQTQSESTNNGEQPPSDDNTTDSPSDDNTTNPPVTPDTSDPITGEFDIEDKENGWS